MYSILFVLEVVMVAEAIDASWDLKRMAAETNRRVELVVVVVGSEVMSIRRIVVAVAECIVVDENLERPFEAIRENDLNQRRRQSVAGGPYTVVVVLGLELEWDKELELVLDRELYKVQVLEL
jgi:hypothetical protein